MKIILAIFFILCYFCFNLAKATPQEDAWLNYAKNLETCSPGSFKLPLPIGADFATYTIAGLNGNICQVTIAQAVEGKTYTMKCSYDKNDLPVLVQSIKDMIAGKTVSTEDAASKISNAACQPVNP